MAENQVAGYQSACAKMASNLNDYLKGGAKRFDSVVLSIATNGSEARLFMTWEEGPDTFKVKHVRSFCLTEEDHWNEFHITVHNILDRRYGERPDTVRACIKTSFAGNGKQRRELVWRRGGQSGSDRGLKSFEGWAVEAFRKSA